MLTGKKEWVTLIFFVFQNEICKAELLLLNSVTSSFTEITQFLLSKEEVSGEMILRYL